MKTLSLYVPVESPVHHLDPITKLTYTVVAIAVPFILPDFFTAIAVLAVSLCFMAVARVFRKTVPIFAASTFFVVTIFLIQGLVYPGNVHPLLTLGPVVFYREGLLLAARIGLRLYNILASTIVLILTTKPSDLIEALVRRGLSPRMGYVMSSVLQIIPIMAGTVSTIQDAQRSRGMETEGSLATRFKAFVPLLGPLVMSSLVGTQERAMALEVRAFNSKNKHTFFHEEIVTPIALLFRTVLIVALAAAVLWRVMA